jgi:hypothetical protein
MGERFTEDIIWQDIPITISCICEWPINNFCHIEIRSQGPNPITNTGYRSHFMLLEYLDGYDSAAEYVKKWLAEASQSKEWKAHVEQARQGNLFDL